MLQLLLHLLGDFITQNNWMAKNKAKQTLEGWMACLTHCAVYSVPFFLIAGFLTVFVIFITHFLIDKFSLAKYVCRIKNWCFTTDHGYAVDTPPWLAVILVMIVDNTMHISINYFAITYL
jgi:hypothetical protein